jgi:hypothetical protein
MLFSDCVGKGVRAALQRSHQLALMSCPCATDWKIRWTTWIGRATIVARKSGDKR